MTSAVESDKTPHVSTWLACVLRPIHTLFMPSFFRMRVTGREHIPKSGPVIITPTHRSRWDPMVLGCATRRLMRSMASQDEFVGVQGWFMRKLGAFPVNTRRPSASTLKACAHVLLGRDVLVIFPEGSIFYYPPDQVHPLKPGTAWLALKVQEQMPDTSIVIVPVRIRYSQLKPKFRSGVELAIQPPIRVNDFHDRPEKEAIRDLTRAIESGMGDVVNTSTAEMISPRDPNTPARKRSYGRPG
jgi:1-acyl-sn-glycerol-3-phosphate acyltransferase